MVFITSYLKSFLSNILKLLTEFNSFSDRSKIKYAQALNKIFYSIRLSHKVFDTLKTMVAGKNSFVTGLIIQICILFKILILEIEK